MNLRRVLLPSSILAMSATAWVAIWRFGESPWGHAGHSTAHWGHANMAGGASLVSLGGLFVTGWVVMTVAMMLPTTLPLLNVFRRLTTSHRSARLLLSLVVSGYLSAWAVAGLLVFGISLLVQPAMVGQDWLAADGQLVAAGLFFTAGAFQFSSLKYQCLEKCRSPLSFVSARWSGVGERWQSFRLGVDHGLFCVGCCWALMLLMFAFGALNLLWMLALAGVMAVEKNASWGRRVSTPLGVVLLVAAGLLVVLPR
ncbi:MAG: DUF2182 domain-containing protein [Acidobacteriota bacterium]